MKLKRNRIIDRKTSKNRKIEMEKYRFVLVVLCRLPKSGSGCQADQKEKSKRNKLHIVRK